jgi:hypothetical protein
MRTHCEPACFHVLQETWQHSVTHRDLETTQSSEPFMYRYRQRSLEVYMQDAVLWNEIFHCHA